ncbi:MAG: glutamyl-tRNA reductase [bacterium]
MEIVILGVSHHTAPIEIREKLAFPVDRIDAALKELERLKEVSECMILSTCNRVEITAAVEQAESGILALKRFIYGFHKLEFDLFQTEMYAYEGENALTHIFRVASSLDSMVIGEPQILGQVKDAFGQAQSVKTLGGFLHTVMHKVFNVAKKVRHETAIAQNAVSISFVAVELAKKIFGEMGNKKVLVIGAGEMSELVLQHLVSAGVRHVFVSNRTLEKGRELAGRFEGSLIPYPELFDHLEKFDIIISSTGSPDYVLHKSNLKMAINARHHRPIFLIDIAVPRDLDPDIDELEGVYLYDIDDLQTVVDSNLKERQKESLLAEKIIEGEVRQFIKRLYTMEISPTIIALRERVERIRRQEVDRALSKLSNLSPGEHELVDKLTSSITNKILHDPVSIIKKLSSSHETFTPVEAVHALFRLDDAPDDPH